MQTSFQEYVASEVELLKSKESPCRDLQAMEGLLPAINFSEFLLNFKYLGTQRSVKLQSQLLLFIILILVVYRADRGIHYKNTTLVISHRFLQSYGRSKVIR